MFIVQLSIHMIGYFFEAAEKRYSWPWSNQSINNLSFGMEAKSYNGFIIRLFDLILSFTSEHI